MERLRQLIKEVLSTPPKKDTCNCGCHDCDNVGNTGVVLNESLVKKDILSENLRYHVDKQLPLTENTFRYGSQSFLNLWSEARYLYLREIIHVNDDDKEILLETNLGEYGMYEGKKVPLDLPMLEEDEEELEVGDVIEINPKAFPNFEFPYGTKGEIIDINNADYASDDLVYRVKIKYIDSQGDETETLYVENPHQYINETEKKTPPIGKPKRGGSKKFYVYVRNKGKVKKVSFGDTTGLSTKINNPKARRAFAARHKCGTGEPRTSARYWSCRIGRYWKQLGGAKNFSGFW
jgi:hypothetical protein